QVGQRLPVNRVLEDGEILAQRVRVELRACRHGHVAIVPSRLSMKALRRLILVFVPLLAVGVPLLASACGGGGSSLASSPGAKIFKQHGCFQCHTLSAVKATGQVGPNLDLLKPDAVTV